MNQATFKSPAPLGLTYIFEPATIRVNSIPLIKNCGLEAQKIVKRKVHSLISGVILNPQP